jgi:hypothetical protein
MSEIAAFVAEHAQDLNAGTGASHMVKPDAMMAAAAHVERDYGHSGYSLGIISSSWTGSGLFEVSHSDGSRFRLYADRWGNVARVPEV